MLVKNRASCICSIGYYFSILQVQVMIFIISNKSEIISPGPKTLRSEISFYFINKIFCFINIFCRHPANTDIKIINNSAGIDIFVIIQKTKKIIGGISRQGIQ